MFTGLLWFDDDPRKDTTRKVGEAAERYQRRFGAAPTICRIHSSASEPASPAAATAVALPLLSCQLTLVPDRRVRPHHFWLGRAEPEPG